VGGRGRKGVAPQGVASRTCPRPHRPGLARARARLRSPRQRQPRGLDRLDASPQSPGRSSRGRRRTPRGRGRGGRRGSSGPQTHRGRAALPRSRPAGAPAPSAPGPAALPPPPRTKWTRRVPHPVLIGHAASLTPYHGRCTVVPAVHDGRSGCALRQETDDERGG